MVQVQAAKVPVAAGVWVEGKDRAEVEWMDNSPRDRAELASAQNAVTKNLMLQDNLVI